MADEYIDIDLGEIGSTDVYVNNVRQDTIHFTASPQNQIDLISLEISKKAPIANPNFTGTATVPAITGLTSINGARLRMDTLHTGFVTIGNVATTTKSMDDYDFLVIMAMMQDPYGNITHSSITIPTGIETEYCIPIRTTAIQDPQHLAFMIQDNYNIFLRPAPYSSSVMVYLKHVHGFKISI